MLGLGDRDCGTGGRVVFLMMGLGELLTGDGRLWVLGELMRPQPLTSDQDTAFLPEPLRLGGTGGGLGDEDVWRICWWPRIRFFISVQFWLVSEPVVLGNSGGGLSSSKSSSVERTSLSDGVNASRRSRLKLWLGPSASATGSRNERVSSGLTSSALYARLLLFLLLCLENLPRARVAESREMER